MTLIIDHLRPTSQKCPKALCNARSAAAAAAAAPRAAARRPQRAAPGGAARCRGVPGAGALGAVRKDGFISD